MKKEGGTKGRGKNEEKWGKRRDLESGKEGGRGEKGTKKERVEEKKERKEGEERKKG